MAHLAYGWQENAKRQEFYPHLIWPHFRHCRNSIPQNSSQSTNRNTEVIPRFGPPTTPHCKHDSTQKLGEQPKEAAKNQEGRRKEKREKQQSKAISCRVASVN